LQPRVPYDEKTILFLIADGDEKAFFSFYSHYSNLLRPFLLHYTRSDTDVEDIIQETFIRVWLHRDQLPEIDNISGWIYRIASRVYLDYVDREIKRRERNPDFGKVLYGTGAAAPEERTHLMELNEMIHKALQTLSNKQLTIYRLNREQDMKPSQIATHLDMPVGTVKNQLSAALKEIRTQLLAMGYSPLFVYYLLSMIS
jgi:RNA polymerase sigma factor (sigma-70 family)